LWKGQLLARGKEEGVDDGARPKQRGFPPRAMYQEGTAMSADYRFDELSKTLAASTSRRRFLKVAAAAAAAGVLSLVRAPEAGANHNHKCRGEDQRCRSNAECCTHFCMEGHCACATPCPGATQGTVTTECCAPGDLCCPGTGTGGVGPRCVKVAATICPTGQSFSNATCKCETVAAPVACPGGNCANNPTCSGVSGCQCLPSPDNPNQLRCQRTA
jgi:hypothetical protein